MSSMVDGPSSLEAIVMPMTPDGQPTKRKYTKSEHYKQRRRHDRFNGMTEDEVRSRTLPDHLTPNLDIVIVSFLLAANLSQSWPNHQKTLENTTLTLNSLDRD